MSVFRSMSAAAILLIAISPAAAQIPGLGSAGKALGGLPNLSSMPIGNAAGVLSYCVKNKVLSPASANSTLSALTSKAGVTQSSDYSRGQSGNLLTGSGGGVSLSSASSSLKSQACNLVLKQAKSFL